MCKGVAAPCFHFACVCVGGYFLQTSAAHDLFFVLSTFAAISAGVERCRILKQSEVEVSVNPQQSDRRTDDLLQVQQPGLRAP